MSKVIEIYDSDDESERVPNIVEEAALQDSDVSPIDSSSATAHFSTTAAIPTVDPSTSTSPPPLIISDVSSINISPFPTILSVHGSPATNLSSSTTSAASTSSAAIIQQSKRSRRKSMHHPLCVSPEIEFETIALDDDEDSAPTQSKNKSNTNDGTGDKQNVSPKLHKSTPKILNTKPTAADIAKQLSDASTEFLMCDETSVLLRQIAEDRVRINFLLASYNMPEIQFSLNTKPEVLQFQLDERIKNRRRRTLEAANQIKKRRSLLQNNNPRTSI